MRKEQIANELETTEDSEPLEATATLPNTAGLHARSAAMVVRLSARFHATITLQMHGHMANTRSLMDLLRLDGRQGQLVRIQARGEDAAVALREIVALIENGFGEE